MRQIRSRREFLKTTLAVTGAAMMSSTLNTFARPRYADKVQVSGHLWVYASRYPPNWDCTPILDQVFSDFKYAGMDGLELMDINLRHDDAVQRLKELVSKYKLPITGTSYSANMWKQEEYNKILEDVEFVLERLHQVGGNIFGISVGSATRMKTEQELDAQADVLKKIMKACDKHNIQPNLHNHTYEVENDLHDLKGTLKRIPEIKLGPDLNWLVRGGVDPVWFIKNYGKQLVYMHIRDQQAGGKWTEAVGDGAMDFTAIAKALHEINYSGRAAIELAFDGPPVNEVKESWKKSRAYVKKVFGW